MMIEVLGEKHVITEIPLNDSMSASIKKKYPTDADWSLSLEATETEWDETSSSHDESPNTPEETSSSAPPLSSLHHHTLTHKRDIIPEESSFHSDKSDAEDEDSCEHKDADAADPLVDHDDEVSIDFNSIPCYYTPHHQNLSGSESSFSYAGSVATRSRANSMDTADSSLGWVHEEEQNLNDSIHLRLEKLQLLSK